MFNRRAKTIWMIGIPDNNLPDKWSSNVKLLLSGALNLG